MNLMRSHFYKNDRYLAKADDINNQEVLNMYLSAILHPAGASSRHNSSILSRFKSSISLTSNSNVMFPDQCVARFTS